MFKKLLPALCALSITNATASATWIVSSDLSPNVRMSVVSLVDGSVVPSVVVFNESVCASSERTPSAGATLVFNGTPVSMVEQCVAKSLVATWPASVQGRLFLTGEFKKKEKVTMTTLDGRRFTFKTKGFKDAYNAKQAELRVMTDAI